MTEKKEKQKKKVVLNPTIINNDNYSEDVKNLNKFIKNDDLVEIQKPNTISEIDNIFRAIIQEFFNDNNISLKTEYVSLNENFAGAKLEFLSKYANVPLMHDFLKTLETKRVSLNRKSRIEMIKVFDKRDEEIAAQNRTNTLKMLGMQ